MSPEEVKALAKAIATANGHPDPDSYAQSVEDAYRAPPPAVPNQAPAQ